MPQCARIDLATKIARVGSDDAICATAVPEPIPHFQGTRRLMLLLSHMHMAFSFELYQSVWNLGMIYWLHIPNRIIHLRDWAVWIWLAGNCSSMVPFPRYVTWLKCRAISRTFNMNWGWAYARGNDLGVMVSRLVRQPHHLSLAGMTRPVRNTCTVTNLDYTYWEERRQQSRFSAAIVRRSKSFCGKILFMRGDGDGDRFTVILLVY